MSEEMELGGWLADGRPENTPLAAELTRIKKGHGPRQGYVCGGADDLLTEPSVSIYQHTTTADTVKIK
jgi:hypothetical protein